MLSLWTDRCSHHQVLLVVAHWCTGFSLPVFAILSTMDQECVQDVDDYVLRRKAKRQILLFVEL